MSNEQGPRRGDGARSLTWTSAAVALVMVIAVWPGDPRAAALLLAGVLAAGALVRALRPGSSPVALTVRSRSLDAAVLGALAVALAVLAVLLPD